MLTMKDNNCNVVVEVYNERYDRQVDYVATHLRAQDFDEVFAATGESPHLDVLDAWDSSSVRCMIFNGRAQPVAVLGVVPAEPYSRVGIVWLLGTDGLDRMNKFFLRISKPVIKHMMTGYDVLLNYVDARYDKTLRWLEWCGFTKEDAEPFGALHLPFHKCYMECV